MATLAELQTNFDNATTALSNAVAAEKIAYSNLESDFNNLFGNCNLGQGLSLTSAYDSNDCKGGGGTGCNDKSTCKNRTATHNSLLSTWNTSVGNVSAANTAYATAENTLKAHPDYGKAVESEEQKGKNIRTILTIAGIVVVIATLTWAVVYAKKKGIF